MAGPTPWSNWVSASRRIDRRRPTAPHAGAAGGRGAARMFVRVGSAAACPGLSVGQPRRQSRLRTGREDVPLGCSRAVQRQPHGLCHEGWRAGGSQSRLWDSAATEGWVRPSDCAVGSLGTTQEQQPVWLCQAAGPARRGKSHGRTAGRRLPLPPSPRQHPAVHCGWRRLAATGTGGGCVPGDDCDCVTGVTVSGGDRMSPCGAKAGHHRARQRRRPGWPHGRWWLAGWYAAHSREAWVRGLAVL
eukprot:296827-Chlamydomonas_euryale.AAC.1